MYSTKRVTSAYMTILRELWGLECIILEEIQEGMSTKNWLVKTTEKQYILRNAGSYENYVKAQLDVIERLVSADFPYAVPRALGLKGGEKYVNYDNSFLYVYRFIPANTVHGPYKISHIVDLVGMLTDFHQALKDIVLPVDFRSKDIFNVDLNSRRVESALAQPSVELSVTLKYFIKLSTSAIEIIGSAIDDYNGLPKTLCHCDWNGGNVLVNGERIIGLIDFGGICYEPLIFDIQNALFHCMYADSVVSQQRIKIFLSHLNKIPLTREEKKLIYPTLLADLLCTLSWLFEQAVLKKILPTSFKIESRMYCLEWLINNRKLFSSFIK